MYCKPEAIFISASSTHEQSVSSTTDFPMDFCFTLVFFFFIIIICVCLCKANKKFLHIIIKICLRDSGKQPPGMFK